MKCKIPLSHSLMIYTDSDTTNDNSITAVEFATPRRVRVKPTPTPQPHPLLTLTPPTQKAIRQPDVNPIAHGEQFDNYE